MNDCVYCHVERTVKNNTFGRRFFEHTEWWDWIRKTKIRKKVSVRIKSPEFKHPRLQAAIMFKNNPEVLFDMKIQYCPKCGRKLGDPDADIQPENN